MLMPQDDLDTLVWAGDVPQPALRVKRRATRLTGSGTLIRVMIGSGIALLIVLAVVLGGPRSGSSVVAAQPSQASKSTPTPAPTRRVSLAQWAWPTAVPTSPPAPPTPPLAVVLDLPAKEWQLPLHGAGVYFTQGYLSADQAGGPGHRGWDMVGPTGSVVYAAASGQVVFANWNSDGYGYMVVVDHADGVQTLYAHLQYIAVGEGWQVEPDTPLGLMGGTGNADGWHLHFETRLNGTPVDPGNYIH